MAPAQDKLPQQFLWVNKDLDSVRLSRSQGQEATSILRFVQQNRPRSHRGRYKLPSRAQHDFVAFETQARDSPSKIQPSRDSNIEDVSSQEHGVRSFRSLQSRWRVVNIPVNNITTGSGIDPFLSMVIPIDSSMYSVLQFAQKKLTDGGGGYRLGVFSKRLKPMGDIYEAAIQYLFREMMSSKHVIFPLLSAFSASIQNMSNSSFAAALDHNRYFQLASEAVRTAIAGNLDDKNVLGSIATGVHFLVCSAALRGRTEETVIHIKGFLKFLPYINTNSLRGLWELDVVSSWDTFNAAARGQSPILKISVNDPGPFPPARLSAITQKLALLTINSVSPTSPHPEVFEYHNKVARNNFDLLQNPAVDFALDLGLSLEAAVHSRRIHNTLIPVLRNLIDCVTVAKAIWQAPDFVTKQDTTWLCKRARTVLHEMLSLSGPKKISISTFVGQQSECLRLTLIILLVSAQSKLLHLSRKEQTTRLKEMLMPIAGLDWRSHSRQPPLPLSDDNDEGSTEFDPHEMLLWILATGHWAAMGTAGAVWFAETAAEVAVHRLRLTGYADLHTSMTKYLYSKTMQRESLEQIAGLMEVEL